MMKMMTKLLFITALLINANVHAAGSSSWPMEHPYINLTDKAALQRGAKMYANYCQGCHSAKFVRYRRLAKDLGITDESGTIMVGVMKDNLMFSADKMGDTIQSAMTKDDAMRWFGGSVPPDLSLVARKRGTDWLYTYLKAFYKDEERPWGANNALFPNVGMPHALLELQGVQEPVYKKVMVHGVEKTVIDKLVLTEPGLSTPEQYDKQVLDLVSFLAYIGEPMKLERQKVGVWVILFVIFFATLAFFLKRAFWKKIH